EQARAHPLRVRSIGRAEHGERREEDAGQGIDVPERDHGALAPVSLLTSPSSSASRAPWITNAAIAVGIAQTDRRSGSISIPFCSRKLLMRRIEAIAMKMSSPKNRPTLSVAAAKARMRARRRSVRGPKRFSEAASAMGARSGLT